jgi:hypothetical protein
MHTIVAREYQNFTLILTRKIHTRVELSTAGAAGAMQSEILMTE